jgi:hypothetical protein
MPDPKLSLDDEGRFNTDYQMFRQSLFGTLLNLPIDPDKDQTMDWRKAWLGLENSDPLHYQMRGLPVNMDNPTFPLLQNIDNPKALQYVKSLGQRPTPPPLAIDPQKLFTTLMQQMKGL